MSVSRPLQKQNQEDNAMQKFIIIIMQQNSLPLRVQGRSCPPSKIHLKIVGYLVAAQSFHEDTNVLMLTTNLIKKDLSPSPVEDAITMNRLSSVVTPDVARDIRSEVFIMLNHSHPHIRKRAVLTLYRVCEKYLEALPQDIIRLQERLDDPDPGVVSAMVNVICELAICNPQDYLPLAPAYFIS
ncbi:hypothetical protein PISMIDRAFT_9707 [Pisolithus microcarpus 441]|uniref:Unplaced genomic scaffold scaffold_25, whole genome shotgun sequence n=1 Tax=Pisolithus microcarpus 441 TaxID=765257 RepID=A0A0C9YK54_9AGAM|nr:hypothetical protein PISMIDRAFT_9707 [Pisolithus microcarpus 441]